MKELQRIYNLAYKEGVKSCLKDMSIRRVKLYEINEKQIKSKLYDYAYKKGYNKIIKNTLNSNRNNV